MTLLAVLVARNRIAAVERDILGKAVPVDVVVASRTVPQGSAFSLENLAKRPIPSAGTSRRNVPAQDFELLLGANAKVEVAEGEPVLWTDVEEPFEVETFSRVVPPGKRAVTINVEGRDAFSGLLRIGDCVDILRESKDGRSFVPLLEDVRILALDHRFLPASSEEEVRETGTITVSASPGDAIRLSSASRKGTLAWLLRNPEDHGRNRNRPGGPVDSSTGVEIWRAGIRERTAPAAPDPGAFQ